MKTLESADQTKAGAEPAPQRATAREIARIAARLFAERGYDATPVRAIAEAAGVTCPTLYYHFGSKEGLAHALITRPLGELVERIRGLLEQAMDPIERLERLAEAHFEFSREDPDRARFVYAVMFGPLGGELANEVNTSIIRLIGLLTSAVGRLVEQGYVAPERVPDVVLALRGQLVIRSVDFLYRGGQLGPGLAARVVADILLGYAEPAGRSAHRGRMGRSAKVEPHPSVETKV